MKRAFSLTELSITILIIGILIMAITKGSKAIENFRLVAAQNLTTKSPVYSNQDLAFWFDATSPDSLDLANIRNGDAVDKWQDSSPLKLASKKIILTQTNDQSKPIFKSNAINGYPAIKFDGDDELRNDLISLKEIADNDQATLFVVQNYNSGYSLTFFWQVAGTSYRYGIHTLWGSNGAIYFDFGICCYSNGRIYKAGPANFVNNNKILTFIRYPSSSIVRIDGKKFAESSTTNSTLSSSLVAPLQIGAQYNGYIGEVIGFNKALSDSQISKIEAYLAQKWGFNLDL